MQVDLLLQLVVFCLYSRTVLAFEQYLLRKCNTTGFCRRNRHYARNIDNSLSPSSYYVIDEGSFRYDGDDQTLYAKVIKNVNNSTRVSLPFSLQFLQDGSVVRFSIDETRTHKNYLPKILNQKRYNETSKWAFAGVPPKAQIIRNNKIGNKFTIGSNFTDVSVELFSDPFLINVLWKNRSRIVVNERSFLNYEHLRSEEENSKNLLPEESDFDMFHDSFNYTKGDNTSFNWFGHVKPDTVPFGPESVALDFTFNNYENLYGLPEHPTSFRIQETLGSEPYRLFSADVSAFDPGVRMPMYGNIPFVIGSDESSASGLFWVNGADTYVDVKYPGSKVQTHWMSETGIIDVVIFLANTPSEIVERYINLTGRPLLPKEAAIGHHQSRWNYMNESDVLTVDSNMENGRFPYDTIWLDLEYTDDRKYFTWNLDAFPNPSRLLKQLADLGRELVVLIDPHLKKGYNISDTLIRRGGAVKNNTGQTHYGDSWPGLSVWIDSLGQLGSKAWGSFFTNFVNNTKIMGIWNDMNEASEFDGIETTFPKDLIHAGGFEHRAMHNIYGLSVHQATYNGLSNIFHDAARPFVLTRSHFAGSQRTAATWTGDNVASWDHLKLSVPMILSSGAAGMPFIGADIAGFLKNPENDLLVRWYQAGLWYPFFRAHSQNETRRREPFLFNDPIKGYLRDAIQLRYHLLPTFYTAFYKAHLNGSPIMKPMIFEKPEYTEFAYIDDQFYLGDSGILVKPITEKNSTLALIKVADGVYYDYHNLEPQEISKTKNSGFKTISVKAPLDKIPILLEGGHIITRRDTYRKSSKYYRNDPYTLVIAPDSSGNARGELYVDDGVTSAHTRGEYLHTVFSLQGYKFLFGNTTNVAADSKSIGNTLIHKIIIAIDNNDPNINISSNRSAKVYRGGKSYAVNVTRNKSFEVVIAHPKIYVNETWQIEL